MELRLKEILKSRHISNRKLAEMTGIMPCAINDLVNGKRSPNVKTLQRIADTVGCDMREFFGEPDERYIICPKCGEKIYYGIKNNTKKE